MKKSLAITLNLSAWILLILYLSFALHYTNRQKKERLCKGINVTILDSAERKFITPAMVKMWFETEKIKVIGEKNGTDTEVYTGALATENGTKIVGTQDSYAAFRYLVIPKNSSSEKYDAAWKFISWAGSEEGQKTLADLTCFAPVNYSVAFGDYTAKNTKWNSWVIANASKNADIADWAYFENGEWVNAWSGDYNDVLREGGHTIQWFLSNNKTTADSACANTSIVIKGRR